MVDASSLIKDTRFVKIYDNEIILENKNSSQAVLIDRRTYSVSKVSSDHSSHGSSVCEFPIQCVYGIIELSTMKYLILVTAANYVGEILSKKVFQVERMCYVPLDKRFVIKSAKAIPYDDADKTYLEMLSDFFSRKFLYFSHDYDLTHTLQHACDHNLEKGKAKPQYFFNEVHLQDFIKSDLSDWVTPIISGLVEIKHINIYQTEMDFILISRRDKRRSGMRFVSRGCDLDGNASNTADTEQIMVIYKKNSLDSRVFSYVQLRGSMPFLWKQKPDMRWEPKGEILEQNLNLSIAKKHFDMIIKEYGNQVVLNLIDKKKTQQKLGLEFQRVVEELAKEAPIKAVWFDFHHECRKMKYENLSKLLNLVETDTSSMGLFEVDVKRNQNNDKPSLNVVQRQKGTFRTNCIDCLDRTNVVQSVIGRKLLHFALIHAKLSDKSLLDLHPFEKFPEELEQTFREIWTKNADALSLLYTGTGALKTDFTRTGKRTKQGALNDGKNSLMRYVKNHFYDGYNQNCVDLVLGKYKPKEREYKKQKINNFFMLAFLIIATPLIVMYILNVLNREIFEPNYHKSGGQLKGLIFNVAVFLLSAYMIFKAVISNPHKFVETPILKH